MFVSGGLGGVHRGGENSMDVSADLTELGRTPVALVTSGKLADNPTVNVVEGFSTILATL